MYTHTSILPKLYIYLDFGVGGRIFIEGSMSYFNSIHIACTK